MVAAAPRRARETARRPVAKRCTGRQSVLQRLERRADVVAQPFEPAARAGLAGFDLSGVHASLLGHAGAAVTRAPRPTGAAAPFRHSWSGDWAARGGGGMRARHLAWAVVLGCRLGLRRPWSGWRRSPTGGC